LLIFFGNVLALTFYSSLISSFSLSHSRFPHWLLFYFIFQRKEKWFFNDRVYVLREQFCLGRVMGWGVWGTKKSIPLYFSKTRRRRRK